ncbi:MAG TPA: helix-turn-helix transcriptional regulator [Coriobacteriaceae bacterium]|nr:helix-turn-helix transcriptional regulator [Coriobacteriaceae bacterium]
MQNASIEKLEYLTSREREVLALLNMGMSRKEIADTLSVSLNTAKKHLSNIYAKLGVRNRNQALDSISAVAAPETSKEVE